MATDMIELEARIEFLRRNYLAEMRDKFAAAALTGLLADPNLGGPPAEFAASAYQYADAMLLARDAQREEGK